MPAENASATKTLRVVIDAAPLPTEGTLHVHACVTVELEIDGAPLRTQEAGDVTTPLAPRSVVTPDTAKVVPCVVMDVTLWLGLGGESTKEGTMIRA